MTLVRVPLTLAAALAFHVSMSPPSTPETDIPGNKRTVCATARFIAAALTKGLFWVSALTDTLVVLTPYAPTLHPLPISIPSVGTLLAWIKHPTQWGPSPALPTSHSFRLPFLPPLPLMAVAGTTLALSGAYLRYLAYHALGQFYACPNRGPGPCAQRGTRGHAHALITSGPYAFVRHPGYAGLALCTTGLIVLQVDALRGSGTGVLGAGRGVGTSVGMRAVALVCAILATVGALRRIREEEESLRARFKGEWERWASEVPYRLVPGVY